MTLAFRRNQGRYCSRCGAGLEDPASEQRGTGPVCAAKDTVLFARMIPANYAGATAILLGMNPIVLPEVVRERFEGMMGKLLKKAEKAQLSNEDSSLLQIQGQDLRPIIKEIDWMLSYHMDAQYRRWLVKIVKFLGYVELAGVLSQEASTSPATVAFDPATGRVSLNGKSCKSGYLAMRSIEGISTPRFRGDTKPYTAPAKAVDKFLEIVQEFWPLYEGDLEEIRLAAHQWQALQPTEAVVAAPVPVQAVPVPAPIQMPPPAPTMPKASLRVMSLMGVDSGLWVEAAFPWLHGKKAEMYGIINSIKTIPPKDRKYNANTHAWLVRITHKQKLVSILEPWYTIEEKD